MAKREPLGKELGREELEKSFTGIYLLSVLPPEMADAVRAHIRAYKHLPEILFDNTPPMVAVEAGEDDQ
jgi:hypothetical protein